MSYDKVYTPEQIEAMIDAAIQGDIDEHNGFVGKFITHLMAPGVTNTKSSFEVVVERLRKNNIPCGLSVYEAGYQTELYCTDGVVRYQKMCATLDEAAMYLDAAARRIYPGIV